MHQIFGYGELIISGIRQFKGVFVARQLEMGDVIARGGFVGAAQNFRTKMFAVNRQALQ